ncbi:AfsR family transcriptional regulator [Streptomyces sp. 3MP-14]|uniref:AfsR family transcriptional regulator n=1 Tax=Streptomyces mimosae TaxID=2586635 RepID=A0A5N6A8G5_9ACTN|nr:MULTISPECIES: BTAD domain-containing putative transcriptional regulator [Streptomyces]KAB8164229.1 AfsR family transcriptional regulator [Streptomyces mimosae]KAB8176506.1 AfsR family transcriptional regulator [Streptomyces sp. 3MP-14]
MAVGEGTTGGYTPALRFAVLGPVRAWQGEQLLPPGSPQQRALLAALLLRRGRPASATELVDALWDEPPQQAIAALRTYASRLRKSFGARASVLVSQSGGYALRLGPRDELDLDEVSRLGAAAEKAAGSGDLTQAHELYGEAVDLWDGEALAGLPGPEAEMQRTRLAEQLLTLREQRLDIGLQAGLHADAVAELTALSAAHPLRERLRELLMLALYRSGRQAEALAVYADARRLLIDELGVEPRAELSELQNRILNADSSLTLKSVPSGSPARPSVRPAQLPAAVPDFTGRASFVRELGAQLAGAGGQVMAVSAVAGIGGVGKTTLAVQVAHAAREHFPDGQLYVDLQGAGAAPADPTAVLAAFLRALGIPDDGIPDGVDERAGLYRSLLAGRRVLTLLDNARDAAQVRDLLPGTPGCATLITSRLRMVDLAGAHLVDLDVMSPDEALTLFTRIVGEERVASERRAAMQVVGACGFLPLAIRIAAARLAARRTWTVSTLARKLSDERRRLDELKAGDQAVKATFELGYGQLEAEQARAFRLLGLTEGPDISLTAAAALLDRDPETTEELLESLVDTSLLESAAQGRYRLHDLVRLFARACAERDEQPPAEREAALSRLLDHFLASSRQVYALERPGDRLVDHVAPTDHPGLTFPDKSAALDWFFSEAECLLARVRQQHASAGLRRAVDTLLTAQDLAESGAFSHQFDQVARGMLETARLAGDDLSQARLHALLAHGLSVDGKFDEADAESQQALLLGTAVGDPLAVSTALNDRGIIGIYRGDLAAAEDYLTRAVAEYRADRNEPGEASARCNLSRVHLHTGRVDSAIELAQSCVRLYSSGASQPLRLANARYTLGVALNEAARHGEALEQFGLAMDGFRDGRQRLWEGVTHYRIAEVHLAAGRPAESARHAERALVLGGIGGEWRRGTILLVLGQALAALQQTDRARACWYDALAIMEEIDAPETATARNLLFPAGV